MGAKRNVKKLLLSSFGFKYGIPRNVNYVFDVRFVPNPFYVAELRPLSGMDEPVRKYIGSFEETGLFLTSSTLFLDFVIAMHMKGDRETLHAAVGCTGGRHRSVAFAEWLCEHYKGAPVGVGNGLEVKILHRDIDKTSEE